MKRRLAGVLLELYPLAFRRRYEEEMRALLDQELVRLGTLLDLLRGALLAHVRPPAGLGDALEPGERLRASVSGVLACWLAFAVAGFGFYETTEDNPFPAVGSAHAALGNAHLTVQVLAAFASAAVILGALPLVLLALGQGRSQPELRRLLSVPFIAIFVFAALTAVLVAVAHSQPLHHSDLARGAFIAWELVGLICGIACVLAARRALFAIPVARVWLLYALTFATLVVAGMVAIALATALYTIALTLDAPRLAAETTGPLALTSTSFALALQLLGMVIASALAITTTRRGWRAVNAGAAKRRVDSAGTGRP